MGEVSAEWLGRLIEAGAIPLTASHCQHATPHGRCHPGTTQSAKKVREEGEVEWARAACGHLRAHTAVGPSQAATPMPATHAKILTRFSSTESNVSVPASTSTASFSLRMRGVKGLGVSVRPAGGCARSRGSRPQVRAGEFAAKLCYLMPCPHPACNPSVEQLIRAVEQAWLKHIGCGCRPTRVGVGSRVPFR